MKKVLTLVFAMVALSSAATWYNNTQTGKVKVVEGPPFSLLLADVLLDTAEVVYSQPIDLINIPIAYRDSANAQVADFSQGNVLVSCFDAVDSAAVTDSVDVSVQLQVAQYAGDNANPSSFKSDAWASLGSAIALDAASAASAIVEGTAAVTLASELDRFVRVQITNDHAVLKDKPRCRVYWSKKAEIR